MRTWLSDYAAKLLASGLIKREKLMGRISSAVLVRSSSEEQLSKISFLFSVLIIKASLNPVLIP